MATHRQRLVQKALELFVPMAPLEDTISIKALAARPHMRELKVETAVWLAIVTHVRHNHTDYHALLDDGYDRDSARHFVLDDMNAVLQRWQATRFVDGSETDDEAPLKRFVRRRGKRAGHIDEDQAG